MQPAPDNPASRRDRAEQPADHPAARPAFDEAVRAWAYVGLNSFGGPAGQIAVIHREIVDRRGWISERSFLHALNYCMLLPGPEAQQLATYLGWLLHGLRGGLVAGLLFIAPGVVAIIALSVLYAGFHDTAAVQALFYGIKPAVVAIVALAVVALGRRALRRRSHVAVGLAAFVAMFLLDVAFPVVVAGAAMAGFVIGRRRPAPLDDTAGAVRRPALSRALLTLSAGLAAWLLPVAVLVGLLGGEHVFAHLAGFFSAAAVVTFGGAYAVLAYVAQQAVAFDWVLPAQMLDGLGMAETTPGPLIMVVQFVGFMAAFGQAGALDPMVAGVLGGLLVSWVTFVPSFTWIFAGAPYSEYLREQPALNAALGGVTAAVVGVIANLAAWFALETLFGVTAELRIGPLRLHTVDVAGLAIVVFALIALVRLRWPLLVVIATSAGLGFAWYLLAAPA